MLKGTPIASTRPGIFPFRGDALSIDLENPIVSACVFFRDWSSHGFIPEAELVDDIMRLAAENDNGNLNNPNIDSDEIVELDGPPAGTRDSSLASDSILGPAAPLAGTRSGSCDRSSAENSSIPELSYGRLQGHSALST